MLRFLARSAVLRRRAFRKSAGEPLQLLNPEQVYGFRIYSPTADTKSPTQLNSYLPGSGGYGSCRILIPNVQKRGGVRGLSKYI